MDYIIKNAKATDGAPLEIRITNGKIAAVSTTIENSGLPTLDANGMTLAPGLIDAHVHLRDPGQTHKEDIFTGCLSAAAGGVCAVLCMPNTAPVTDSPQAVRYITDKARTAAARVFPIAAITKGLLGKELCDFEALRDAGAVALSDDGRPVMDAEIMRLALKKAVRAGLTVVSHCEDFNYTAPYTDSRFGLPVCCSESAMVARDLSLALELDAPLHIAHVSTAATVALIREAKRRGARVTAETCPHYLLLTRAATQTHGTNAMMNPPLATDADRAAVLEAVVDGTIDIIVTDHAPHTASEKASDTPPNGIVGLETLLAGAITALSPHLSLPAILDKLTAAPAKIFGLDGGVLRVGAAADLVLFDPCEGWTVCASALKSKSKNTPFDGLALTGRAKATILGGEITK